MGQLIIEESQSDRSLMGHVTTKYFTRRGRRTTRLTTHSRVPSLAFGCSSARHRCRCAGGEWFLARETSISDAIFTCKVNPTPLYRPPTVGTAMQASPQKIDFDYFRDIIRLCRRPSIQARSGVYM
jgi:hypothetical protein